MKQLQLLVYLFIISVLPLQAQITITYADMPIFGKKYIYSMSNDFKSINPALTGANYTWDFKNLKDSVQYTDSIMAITTAPQMYQFIFNSLLDPKPTFCIPKSNLNNLDSLSKYQPTEVYEYYRITAQNYSYVGFGVNLKSVSVPIKYDTVDVLYNFPLSYGKADSGTSFFEAPSIAWSYIYFASHQKRKNNVDGWGTLKTPYGNFSTLRIKSTINAVDTFYYTTDSKGYKIQQPTRYEYKWLGQNSGVPLLQVNTEMRNSIEVVTSIYYQDSLRINSIAKANHPESNNIRVYPNPFNQNTTVEYRIDKYSLVSIELIDINGKTISLLQSGIQKPGTYNLPLNIENNRSSVYFIKFRMNNQVQYEKLTNIR